MADGVSLISRCLHRLRPEQFVQHGIALAGGTCDHAHVVIHRLAMTTQTFILPASVAKPGIFLCTPVDAEVVARSAVLRDLSNTAGTATLPDGMNEDDVLSWLSMDPKDISKRSFSLRELCTAMRVRSFRSEHFTKRNVMNQAAGPLLKVSSGYVVISWAAGVQVASRLGDGLATEFASALASKIRQQTENIADVEDVILSLDQSAQHDVFQRCISVSAVDSVAELIVLWPKRLQQVRDYTRDGYLPSVSCVLCVLWCSAVRHAVCNL